MNKARRIIEINEFSTRGVSTINTEYAIDAVNETAKQWREHLLSKHTAKFARQDCWKK